MTETQREEFLMRLADDQAAREAVARAVELGQVTSQAFEVQPVQRSVSRPVPVARLSPVLSARVVFASSVLIAGCAAFWAWYSMTPQPVQAVATVVSDDLVEAWTSVGQNMDQDPMDVAIQADDWLETGYTVPPDSVEDLDQFDESESWMLQAMIGLKDEPEDQE